MNIERIMTPTVLVIINLIIIIAAEATGELFLETGLIHIIALFFLILGISRIFVHYKTFDQYLQPLLLGSVAAILLFSFSHVVEYFSFGHGEEAYDDALYVDVTNMYSTAMLLVALGAQFFIYKRVHKLWTLLLCLGAFALSLALTILGLIRSYELPLEPDEPWIYLYGVLVLLATYLSVSRMHALGSATSIMKQFSGYLVVAFILVAGSALYYLAYELLEELGLPDTQIIYISHFMFYAALSLMFLAYPRLAKPQGLYALDK